MKILFVDDNQLNRLLMLDMMEMLFEEIEVEIYESAAEVLALDIEQYELILSDIDMPDINGFELYTLLREKNYKKPIIAVTALAVNGDRERILEHGFSDYISKPIDMDLLEKAIQQHI